MESLAFTRLCLHRVAKESERKVVREDGKGEGKRENNRKFTVMNSYKKRGGWCEESQRKVKKKRNISRKAGKEEEGMLREY